MKNYILTLGLFISSACAFAQSSGAVSPYVFPQFVKASVLQKGGGVTEATMDYNTLTQEMLFMQKDVKTVLDMDNVDTIYLENKKFIPVGKLYYEKLTNTPVALYIQHFNKKIQSAKKAEFDKTAAINSAMTAAQGFKKASTDQSQDYDLTISDTYVLQPESTFWLQKGKSFSKANDLKSIQKVFPGKADAMEAYIKENKLNISNADDLAKLIIFANK